MTGVGSRPEPSTGEASQTERLEPSTPFNARPPWVTLERGALVGRYVVLEPIARGGMGMVYKAYDPELDRRVALKVLAVEGGPPERRRRRRERLLGEAKALAQLAHPNVVAVHDVGTFDDAVFLTMELVEGKTLRAFLKGEPPSLREIVQVFLAAGEGLAAAHRAGLVHRDFKPDNVIIGLDGRVRVLDFGLARAAPTDSGSVDREPASGKLPSLRPGAPRGSAPPGSASAGSVPPGSVPAGSVPPGSASAGSVPPGSVPRGSVPPEVGALPPRARGTAVAGTPEYMAPEQYLGQVPDARCDQFSFCVALHEALYGVRPFRGRTREELELAIVSGHSLPPPRTARRVHPRYRRIIQRGLAPRADARFATMDDLLAELRRDPHERLRRWLALGVALLVSLTALGLVRRAAGERALVCRGGDDRVAKVWSQGVRDQVTSAFAGTTRPSARAALQLATSGLDAYASAWVDAHREACEATRVRGEQSEELLDLRMECLDQRLLAFGALVNVLEHADATVVARASRAVQELPRLEACADRAALKSPVRPPSSPEARARVDELRHEIARARALLVAGKFDEGLRVAVPAAALAPSMHYRVVEAEANLVLAELRERSGDYEGGLEALRRAIAAADAGRHDEVRARALLVQVWITGERLGHPKEGLAWADHAEGTIERLGERQLLLAGLHRVRAVLYYRQARYEEALAAAERCRTLREPLLGRGHPDVGECVSDISIAYYFLGQNEQALAFGKRALEIWEQALGSSHVDVASALNNLGEIHRAENRLDEALVDFRRALSIWEELGHVDRAVPLKNIGDVLLAQGHAEGALEHYGRATRIWREVLGGSHPSTAVGLSSEGDALLRLGRLDEAIARYEDASKIREKSLGLEHPDLALDLLGMGEAHLAKHEPSRAVPLLERAVALREASTGDPRGLAEARFALARALSSRRGEPRARAYAEAARSGLRALGSRGDDLRVRVEAFLAALP